MGEVPSLWTWVSLAPVTELNQLPSAVNMLRSMRLSLATCLEARVVSRELLEAIGDHPGLRGLDIGYSTCFLANIPASLLLSACPLVCRVKVEFIFIDCFVKSCLIVLGCFIKLDFGF